MRKYYLFDAEKRIGGGRLSLEEQGRCRGGLHGAWQAYIAERYGTPPDIRYFETSVVVDNESEKTILDAAA